MKTETVFNMRIYSNLRHNRRVFSSFLKEMKLFSPPSVLMM
ncbi:hypothetical protein CHCC20372_2226 [Bacillus paralicheniformis]|nr:hypothetical protein CHCC20372_2226 [Bacillus paralicheniformis]